MVEEEDLELTFSHKYVKKKKKKTNMEKECNGTQTEHGQRG